MDAPTPPTTVTEEHRERIDYVLYQSASMSLTGIGRVPRLTSPIPDETHASDHLPISARFVLRSKWAQVEEDARQWLACISGTTAARPLSPDALRSAFDYFDKVRSGRLWPQLCCSSHFPVTATVTLPHTSHLPSPHLSLHRRTETAL